MGFVCLHFSALLPSVLSVQENKNSVLTVVFSPQRSA